MSPTLEFLIIFIGALLLGALIHKICCSCRCGCCSGDSKKTDAPKNQASLVAAPAITSAAKRDDDLTIIEGIGPAINKVLNAHGIHTFADVARTDKEKIHTWLAEAGPQFRMHDASTWKEQAELARDGKFTELESLKVRLNNGQHA